ncbi:MAG: redoxin domain-containing protein, partial [Patescibacteria group bacterium]|nr:redoxin domain-containing protein [Patescibacteria group bacterium]
VLAPCVLPLLPVILAGSVSETVNKRRPIIIISSLAISVFIFTLILKGSTALINVGPSVLSFISAAILAAFGLTLIFPETWAKLVLKIPGHNRPDRWITKGYGGRSSFWTDVIVGAALGPVFTTCSPTFFVILATVLPASFAMGAADLLAYIIGLALILLLVAFIGQRIIDRLGWATDPNGWFRKALGVLFIILAVAIVGGYDKQLESSILNSGFFDVTNVEQSIHQALESSRGNVPSAPTSAPAGAGSAAPSPTLSPQAAGGTSPLLPPEQNEGQFTEIAQPAGFINSQPFKLADFVGKKVILVDFIDYTCINCQRTFPYLESWWNKYKDQGLEVVAIHTPEFSFEHDIANVEMGAKEFGLTFPIVLDNSYATWNAYKNEYWPHKYLIDIHGDVVYDHIGEGGYDETEAEIVKLLNERKQALGESGTVVMGTSTVPDVQVLTESPETYFGSARNEYFGNGEPGVSGEQTYAIPNGSLTPNAFYLGGDWKIASEYAETAGPTASNSGAIDSWQLSYTFAATKMYMIALTADGKPATATVLIDGKPIPPQWAGKDVDSNGVLHIQEQRLYDLYVNQSLGRHRIDIIFDRPGVRVYTFTFG